MSADLEKTLQSTFENLKTDVNKKDLQGRTALHNAAERNDLLKIEQLLSQGADVNAKDRTNITPLHDAAFENVDESHLKVIEELLRNGADVHAQDEQGRTPIYYLVRRGNVKTVQLFLNYNADVSVLDNEGESLLFPAVGLNDNVEVVQLLIDLGLDVHQHCSLGGTPLHWASWLECNNIKNIKCLLKNHADPNAVNNEGSTPLIVAAYGFICNRKLDEAVIKKKFNFIMEHTDFGVVHEDLNILTLDYKPGSEYLWKWILEHIAKLQTLFVPVHQNLLSAISERKEYDDYYKQCQEELLRAKSTKLHNSWVTFYKLLVDHRKKLKNYAGNKVLIGDFNKSDCEKKFPIYGSSMVKNVKKGIERRELFDESAAAFSNFSPIFDPKHLIVYDVFNCVMSKKDLSKFCE